MALEPFTRVEIILDSGSRSREMRQWVDDMQKFFRKAAAEGCAPVDAKYIDTNLLFHEKTGFITPEQAPTRAELWPGHARSIANAMKRNHYEVLPSGEEENQYRDALQNYLFGRDKREGGKMLEQFDAQQPQDLTDDMLQSLFNKYLRSLPKDSPDRRREDFREYADIRADAGERSVADYLAERDSPPEGERVITVFVTQDHAARKNVRDVAEAKPTDREIVFSTGMLGAKDIFAEIVNQYQRHNEAARDIEFDPEKTLNRKRGRQSDSNRDAHQGGYRR